jgi:hypothetical protein
MVCLVFDVKKFSLKEQNTMFFEIKINFRDPLSIFALKMLFSNILKIYFQI